MNNPSKEHLFQLFDKIETMAAEMFPGFEFEKSEHVADVDESGNLKICSAHFSLIAKKKFVSFLIHQSISKNKPFHCIIGIGHNDVKWKGFNIEDYVTFRKIKFDKRLLFRWLNDYEESVPLSQQIFLAMADVIKTEEIQKLLNTDYRIEVPIDYSPYK